MPGKKRAPRTRKLHSVSLQFSVRYAVPVRGTRGAPKIGKEVLDQAIKYWIEHGEDPEGFEVTPIEWQHGDKTTLADDPERFRIVLGRFLQSGSTISIKIRRDERI